MSFPRYPKYKDSGVEWLGEVPEHWTLNQGRRLFTQERESARPTDDQLSATQKYGVVPQKLFMEMEDQKVALALNGLNSFKHVEAGDFVISLRSFQGGIERSAYPGCVSPAYTVLRPAEPIDGRFWSYLLKSKGYIEALQSMTDGIRDGKNISYQQFGQIIVPAISLPEQTQIAAFLDRETAKIDELVAEQRRLMELLKEKRQAVISHAVTKGLNPDAPMKPSGIEWLGDVPAHWDVKRFQRCVYVAEGQVDPENLVYSAMSLIAPNHIESGTGRLLELESASDQGAVSGKYLCKAGDVIYSKIRPALRKVCIAPEDCLCSADMYPLRSHSKLTNPFLIWSILSEQFSALAVLESQRVAMPKINRESLKEVMLMVPPVEEQKAIVEFLNTETAEFDTLTAEAQRAIDLLQERRTALISAAVTGQIDVRAAL